MEGICYIIGAGEVYSKPAPGKRDMVIAADGGYEHLQRWDMKADVVIGDFDSMSRPEHPCLVALAREKDDTDTLAALRLGLSKGYEVFHIYGGTGGRAEHSIANIQCLVFLTQHKARGFLFGKDTIVTALRNGSMSFGRESRGYVSVFAYSGAARGVFLKGLKYELTDVVLSDFIPIGVSNEFMGIESSISVKDGVLIIMYPLGVK